jgi:hypothetical protein
MADDFSGMSDAELEAIVNGAHGNEDLSNLSDAELEAIVGGASSAPPLTIRRGETKLTEAPNKTGYTGVRPEGTPGILSNAPNEGYGSAIAKGGATAAIQGLGDRTFGLLGNVREFRDSLLARGLQLAGNYIPGVPAMPEEKTMETIHQFYKDHPILSLPLGGGQLTGDEVVAPILAKTGQYQATSIPGRMAQGAVRAAVGSPTILAGMGAQGVRGALQQAVSPKWLGANAALGGGGELASEAFNDPLTGNLIAMGALPVAKGVRKVTQPATDMLPNWLGGNRDRATGQMILKNTENPEAALANLAFQPKEIVEGSIPTTPELSLDPQQLRAQQSLVAENHPFELNGQETGFGSAVNEQHQANVAARKAALETLAPEGMGEADKLAPSRMFQRLHDAAIAKDQESVQRISALADQENSKIPAKVAPEAIGETYQEPYGESKKSRKDNITTLYDIVEQNGPLQIITKYASDEGKAINKSLQPHPDLPQEQAAIAERLMPAVQNVVDELANLKAQISFGALRDVDRHATAALYEAKEKGTQRDVEIASRVKSALMGTINDAIDNHAKFETERVRNGEMDYKDTLESRLGENLREPDHFAAAAEAANAGGYPENYGGVPREDAVPEARGAGADSEAGNGLASIEGGKGVSQFYQPYKPERISEVRKPPRDIVQAVIDEGGINDSGIKKSSSTGDFFSGAAAESTGTQSKGGGGDVKQMELPKGAVKETGRSPEMMADRLIELGYLPETLTDANKVSEMKNAIERSHRADDPMNKVHSVYDQDYVERYKNAEDWRGNRDAARSAADEVSNYFEELNKEAGTPGYKINKDMHTRATAYVLDGETPAIALERAARDLEDMHSDKQSVKESRQAAKERADQEARWERQANRKAQGYPEQIITADEIKATDPDKLAQAIADLRKAKDAHIEMIGIDRKGPVALAMKSTGAAGTYDKLASTLPSKLFKSGDTGYETTSAFLKAADNKSQAVQAVKDAATNDLRKEMKDAPRLTQQALDKWKRDNAESLRAIDEIEPGFSKKFDTAAKATSMVEEASAIADERAAELSKKASAKFIGLTSPSEVKAVMGKFLESKTGPSDVASLMKTANGDSVIIDGLRRAGLDHIKGKVGDFGATARKYIQSHIETLKPLFGDEGVATALRLSADMERAEAAAKTLKVAGSNTTEKIAPIMKKMVEKHGNDHGIGTAMLVGGIEAVHEFGKGAGILIGAGIGAKIAASHFYKAGQKAVQQRYMEAMFDPVLGRILLERAIKDGKPNTEALSKFASAFMRRSSRLQEQQDNLGYLHQGGKY